MNEQMAINVLYGHLRSNVVAAIPRFTPAQWWECDLYVITKAMMAVEYEVKLSRADFKADAKKSHLVWNWNGPSGTANKHDLLAGASDRAPNRFYYVTPQGLLALEDVPQWAGLIEIANPHKCGTTEPNHWYGWRVKIVKRAPYIHRTMREPDLIHKINRALGYRFWNIALQEKAVVA